MPRVQQYQPDQVRTEVQQVVQPARQQDSGLQTLAKGISDIGKMAGEMKKQADLYSTEEAANNFEREKNDMFFNPETGYFNTQGRDAFETGGKVTEQLEKLKEKYGSSLSPQARMEFERVANQQIARGNVDVMRHASKNLQAWDAANLQVEVENTLENASLDWQNMKQLNIHRAKGVLAVREAAKAQGMSAEQANESEQNYRSAFAMSTIAAATQKSAGDGEEAMRLYGDALEGPDKVKMLEAIEKKDRITGAKDKANQAVLVANNLVDTYGDGLNARLDMIAAINDQYKDDAEMQKIVKAEATYQLDQKFRADGERRGNVIEMAEQYIFGDEKSWQAFEAEYTAEWDDLTQPQRAALKGGAPIATNYVEYGNLIMQSDAEIAKIIPAEHRHYLAATEYKELVRTVKAARAGKNKFEMQGARANSAVATAGVETILGKKKSDWGKNELKKANAIYEVITNNVGILQEQKGGKLTPTEYTNAVNEVSLTYFTSPESFLWFDPAELTLDDVPDADIREITRRARLEGQTVSTDYIVKKYLEAEAQKENK